MVSEAGGEGGDVGGGRSLNGRLTRTELSDLLCGCVAGQTRLTVSECQQRQDNEPLTSGDDGLLFLLDGGSGCWAADLSIVDN